MAATGVGLVATIAVGAVAGATIAGATAAASTAQQNNGKVDWETVGICAGVGGAVGALASAAGYLITSKLTTLQIEKSLKAVESNRKNHILQAKHNWDRLGKGQWSDVSKAMKYTLKNGTSAAYKTGGQTITTATYKSETVQVITKIVDGVLKIVDAWII